jgi:hypothetical protein
MNVTNELLFILYFLLTFSSAQNTAGNRKHFCSLNFDKKNLAYPGNTIYLPTGSCQQGVLNVLFQCINALRNVFDKILSMFDRQWDRHGQIVSRQDLISYKFFPLVTCLDLTICTKTFCNSEYKTSQYLSGKDRRVFV